MSVLSVLGQVAGVAGAGYGGYGEDKALAVKQAMAKTQADREEEDSRVRRLLEASQTNANNARATKPDVVRLHTMPNGDLVAEYTDGTYGPAQPHGATVAPSVAAPAPIAPPAFKDFGSDVERPGGATAALQDAQSPAQVPAAPKPPSSVASLVRSPVQAPAANFARPAAPRNIDPLSKEGQQAMISVDSAKKANAPTKNIDVLDPKGNLVRGKDVVGAARPTPAGGSATARGFGPGGIFGGASGIASVGEMQKALPELEKFDTGTLSEAPGSPNLKLFDQFRQNILDAGTHASSGVFGSIGTAVNAALNAAASDENVRLNPALANYARYMKQYIVADMNLARSATDERARWDQIASSLLGVPISDMPIPERIKYVRGVIENRRTRVAGLQKAVPAAESMLESIANHGRQAAHAVTPNRRSTDKMSEDAWAAQNPPSAGESFDAYHARYLKSQGAP